jgi:hypothetical protein
MALYAYLKFGDNSTKSYTSEQTYAIIDFRFHFTRHYNLSFPDENARCKCFEVTMYAPEKTNTSLYSWYIDGTALTGRIEFQLPANANEGNDITTGYLYFSSAYCYSISQYFKQDVTSSRLLKLMFVAESIQVDGVNFPQ